MDPSGSSGSMRELVREHALREARAKGWYVEPADCTVAHVDPPLGVRTTTPVIYWEAKVRIRAALNRHRALTKDSYLSGIVRISGNSLLANLTEASDALRARLQSEGQG